MESSLTPEGGEKGEFEETKSRSEEGEVVSSDTPMDILITSAPGDVEDDDDEEEAAPKPGPPRKYKRFEEEYSSGPGDDDEPPRVKLRRPSSSGKSRA